MSLNQLRILIAKNAYNKNASDKNAWDKNAWDMSRKILTRGAGGAGFFLMSFPAIVVRLLPHEKQHLRIKP